MVLYPISYRDTNNRYIVITGKMYDTVTKQIVDNPPVPSPEQPQPIATRSFDLPLGKVSGTKGFGFHYGDLITRGNGEYTFYPDYVKMSGSAPRLYVYDSAEAKIWKNVEVIVEYMRVSENNPPSYAGLGIGVRSNHHKQTSTFLQVPTYYLKHCFDSRFMFEKETVHNQSYVKRPALNRTMEKNAWYRMTFKVVGSKLEGSLEKLGDPTRHYQTYTDTGTWNGAVIPQGVSCFIRNDSVTDFRVRKFSIKELA